jgi:hypothetical protein
MQGEIGNDSTVGPAICVDCSVGMSCTQTLNYGDTSPILQFQLALLTFRQHKKHSKSSFWEKAMNPLTSVKGAITAAVILAVVVSALLTVSFGGDAKIGFHAAQLGRTLHIVAGVMWIGLLYYFNVVQVPGMADAAADKGGPGGAGVSKYIAPRALWWFRWAAVLTWITGAYYLMFGFGNDMTALHQAFTLQAGFRVIGVGAWLGTIMLFNVWVLIWPNQKKILGIVPATDDEKAKARKVALYASRTNFILSVPMIMCMGGQGHGLPF